MPPGNSIKGERQGRAKLTDADVNYIRARYAEGGITMWQLAKEKGISESRCRAIIRFRGWKHLGQPQMSRYHEPDESELEIMIQEQLAKKPSWWDKRKGDDE